MGQAGPWGPKFRLPQFWFRNPQSVLSPANHADIRSLNSRFRFHKKRKLPSDARFPRSQHGGYLHPIATFVQPEQCIVWSVRILTAVRSAGFSEMSSSLADFIISDPAPPPVKLHNRCPVVWEGFGRDFVSCNVNCTCSTSPPAGGYGTARNQLAPLGPNFCGLRWERLTQLIYRDREMQPPPTHRTPRRRQQEQPANRIAILSASSSLFFPNPIHPKQPLLSPASTSTPPTAAAPYSSDPAAASAFHYPTMLARYFLVDGRCRKPTFGNSRLPKQPERQINKQLRFSIPSTRQQRSSTAPCSRRITCISPLLRKRLTWLLYPP